MAGSSWTNQVVNRLIIAAVGSGGGLFVYNTATPQLNALLASIVSAAGSDGAGNATLAGGTFYHHNLVNGDYFIAVNFNASGTNGNSIILETAVTEAGPWTTQGVIGCDNAGNMTFSATNAIVVGSPPFLSAADPAGTGTTPDTWHTMSGFTNSWAATANTPRYVLLPDGNVQIDGVMDATSATAGAFFTIPAAYRPTSPTKLWAGGANGGVIAGQAPFIQAASTGVLSIGGVTLPTAGAHVTISGIYTLT
jgi:hypothetical protein